MGSRGGSTIVLGEGKGGKGAKGGVLTCCEALYANGRYAREAGWGILAGTIV